jgi:hypothetical protein
MSDPMNVYRIDAICVSFGSGVITPRWRDVLAPATSAWFDNPSITDNSLDATNIKRGHQS